MSQTNKLKLNKHDNPSTNENQFDIDTYLNENWDKIDAGYGELDISIQANKTNIETLQTEVTELQEDVQNLRNASYKVSGSGTNFSLNNTTKNKFIEFLPGGNTEQTQLSGKNLAVSEFQDKISFSGSGNNRTVVSSNYKFSQIIKVEPNTTYTVNGDYSSLSDQRIRIFFFNEYPNIGSVSTKYLFSDISSAYTFTTETNTNYIVLYGVVSTPADVILPNLQLEEGTTATDYEPYVGGIPSPNTDYPQQIYKVVGNVTNKIENKNFVGEMEQGSIAGTTGEPGISTTRIRTKDFIKAKYNSYVISCKNSSSYKCIVFEYDKNQNFLQRIVSTWSTLPFSFTISNNTKYIKFIIAKSNDTDILPSEVEELQLETETAVTDYEEHQEQNLILTLGTIELCKLDTAKDYFFKNNGKWYLHKEIGKKILNGTEVWYGGVYGSYYRCYTSITGAKTYPNLASSIALSNYFNKTINVFVSDNIKKGMFGQYSNTTNFYFGTDETSVADFKTWLSTHNTEVYYLLATPTDTEITDETLISQLETIEKAMAYNDQTNISSESDEVGMIIDATAVGDINKVISNIDSRVSLLE